MNEVPTTPEEKFLLSVLADIVKKCEDEHVLLQTEFINLFSNVAKNICCSFILTAGMNLGVPPLEIRDRIFQLIDRTLQAHLNTHCKNTVRFESTVTNPMSNSKLH